MFGRLFLLSSSLRPADLPLQRIQIHAALCSCAFLLKLQSNQRIDWNRLSVLCSSLLMWTVTACLPLACVWGGTWYIFFPSFGGRRWKNGRFWLFSFFKGGLGWAAGSTASLLFSAHCSAEWLSSLSCCSCIASGLLARESWRNTQSLGWACWSS